MKRFCPCREGKGMNKIRIYFGEKLNENAKIMGIIVGFGVLTVLLAGLFSGSRLGTVDNGEYAFVMEAAGLTYTSEDDQDQETLTYDRVIEKYEYTTFTYAKLFAPYANSSIVYPIAVIRLFTDIFGLGFSVKYLYIIYALLFAYGSYSLVRSLAFMAGKWAMIPGAVLLLVTADRNLTAYLGSLYTTATVILGLLLMTAMSFRLFTYGRGRGICGLALYLASVIFCINASDISCVFIPFAVAATVFILMSGPFSHSHRIIVNVAVTAILVVSCYSSLTYFKKSQEIEPNAAAYHAAFEGFLEGSEDAQKDLSEFGLDESYAEDIGKSYYLEAAAYTHNPHGEEEAEALFSKLNQATIKKWYMKHPIRLLKTLMAQDEDFNSFENKTTLNIGAHNGDESKISRIWALADMIVLFLLPESYYGMNILFCVLSIGAMLIFLLLLKRKEKVGKSLLFAGSLWLWGSGIYSYALLRVLCSGGYSLEHTRLCSVFFLVFAGSIVLMAAGKTAGRLADWYEKTQFVSSGGKEADLWAIVPKKRTAGVSFGVRFRDFAGLLYKKITGSRKNIVLSVLCVAVFMSMLVQFCGKRAGCVNNGDYGRMMEQLGLTWTEDIYSNYSAQTGHSVIENYACTGRFDWTSLTFLNPSYSLVYPTAIVRGICTLFKTPFSTWYLSILLNLILVLCIVSIVRDLYTEGSGRWSLLLGMELCAVFLSESYLVWFNGLYGEGCIFLGIFMVGACCVHLSVTEAGKGKLTVFLLIFCVKCLICAKAQMLAALPIGLFLVVIYAWYHRPLP